MAIQSTPIITAAAARTPQAIQRGYRTYFPASVYGHGETLDTFRKIPLFIITTLALLYLYGKYSKNEESKEDPYLIPRKVGTDILQASVIQYGQSALFQLLGLGYLAYQIGKENNGLDQAKAVVNVSIPFMCGLGCMIINRIYESLELGHLQLRQTLERPALQTRMNGKWDDLPEEIRRFFESRRLNELLQALKTYEENILSGKIINYGHVEKLRLDLEEKLQKTYADMSQEAFKDSFQSTVREKFDKTLYPAMKELGGKLSLATHETYNAIHLLNPFCAFFIGATLLGLPLSTRLAKWIEEKYPQWREIQTPTFKQFLTPSVKKSEEAEGAEEEHNAEEESEAEEAESEEEVGGKKLYTLAHANIYGNKFKYE